VYIILLASEKDRCPMLCVVLVLAVGEIAAVMQHWNVVSENESEGNFDWEEWRLIESQRRYFPQISISGNATEKLQRTTILLWLLEMLLDVNIGAPASKSCKTLDQIPLPPSKRLWYASTKSEWEEPYKCYWSFRRSADMPKIGDLRTAQESDAAITMSLEDDLRDWSSSADSFGGLIMMVIR
jgi:hypothetical protein